MTIAACYLSTEGGVLAADSTSTLMLPTGVTQHLEHAQEVFEIGTNGTLGVVTWGMGQLGGKSYRTMAAELDDAIRSCAVQTFDGAVNWWNEAIWNVYECSYAPQIAHTRILHSKSLTRTISAQEQMDFNGLMSMLGGGFCIAGRFEPDRTPSAYQITYNPLMSRANSIHRFQKVPDWAFWGCPNITERIIGGINGGVKQVILQSGKWSVTEPELDAVLRPLRFEPNPNINLPMREAADWMYSMIHSTIKAFKFSPMPPFCGGPIDVAVITSDRSFRWVRHKSIDAAISRDVNHHRGCDVEWLSNNRVEPTRPSTEPQPEWVESMRKQYFATRTVPANLIHQVLGDPTKATRASDQHP